MGPRVRADVYTVLHTAVHTGATRDGRGRMSAEWQKVGVGRRVRVFWGSSAVTVLYLQLWFGVRVSQSSVTV